MTDADYTDNLELLRNTFDQAESLLQFWEQAAGGIIFYTNRNKIELYILNKKLPFPL